MKPNYFQESMPLFGRLYVFGAGGFGREAAWLAAQILGEGFDIRFLVDDPAFLEEPTVNGIPVSLLSGISSTPQDRYIVALGSPADRQRVASILASAGFQPATLVHPRVEMSKWATIDAGSIICANSVITCNVLIGSHVHINLGCSIGHDVVIGDYSTLSPGVNVSGNVHIGRSVFVGTNASFINGKQDAPLVVGDGAVIAAGACVTRDVSPAALVAGVPAVLKERRR